MFSIIRTSKLKELKNELKSSKRSAHTSFNDMCDLLESDFSKETIQKYRDMYILSDVLRKSEVNLLRFGSEQLIKYIESNPK